MSWCRAAVDRYVAERRVMGARYDPQSRFLAQLAESVEASGDAFLRVETLVACAQRTRSSGMAMHRLAVYRHFARWLAVEDGRHEVPPDALLRTRPPRRPSPHLLDLPQIAALLRAAESWGDPERIDGYTYATLFGLIAATGLRKEEAASLQFGDVTANGLIIRDAKFGKSRLVPLDPSVQARLRAYLRKRRRVGGGSSHFFVLATGRRPSTSILGATFRKLAERAGLRKPGDVPGPTIHSLRHSFAVRSLQQRVATDPEAVRRHAYYLSVYLGHGKVSSTYWYLEATAELLGRIAQASESGPPAPEAP